MLSPSLQREDKAAVHHMAVKKPREAAVAIQIRSQPEEARTDRRHQHDRSRANWQQQKSHDNADSVENQMVQPEMDPVAGP